jgi:hypothetical protein
MKVVGKNKENKTYWESTAKALNRIKSRPCSFASSMTRRTTSGPTSQDCSILPSSKNGAPAPASTSSNLQIDGKRKFYIFFSPKEK